MKTLNFQFTRKSVFNLFVKSVILISLFLLSACTKNYEFTRNNIIHSSSNTNHILGYIKPPIPDTHCVSMPVFPSLYKKVGKISVLYNVRNTEVFRNKAVISDSNNSIIDSCSINLVKKLSSDKQGELYQANAVFSINKPIEPQLFKVTIPLGNTGHNNEDMFYVKFK